MCNKSIFIMTGSVPDKIAYERYVRREVGTPKDGTTIHFNFGDKIDLPTKKHTVIAVVNHGVSNTAEIINLLKKRRKGEKPVLLSKKGVTEEDKKLGFIEIEKFTQVRSFLKQTTPATT